MRTAAPLLLLLAAGLTAAAASPEAPPQSCASGTPVTVGGVSYKTKFTVLKDGSGGAAISANNTKVSAAVVGTIAATGASFWNSSDPPVAPGTPHPDWFDYSFVLPPKDGGLIVGFDVGSFGMKVGEVRELCIPPEEGYGSHARTGIPAGSTLVFTLTCGKIAALKSDDAAAAALASPRERAAAAQPHKIQCEKTDTGLDYAYGDLRMIQSNTTAACCAACLAEPLCILWVKDTTGSTSA